MRMRKIDNSHVISEKLLKFDKPGDFFVVHMFQRRKDGHRHDSLLRTKLVYSKEYWDERIDDWKNFCAVNEARLYIVPTRRNMASVVPHMMKGLCDMIGNPTANLDGFMKSAVCGCHTSDRKRWVIDIDKDDFEKRSFNTFEDYRDASTEYVLRFLSEDCRNEFFKVDTPNGCHIVTPPFDMRNFYTMQVKDEDRPPFGPVDVKKDDMTLVYFNKDMCNGCKYDMGSEGCGVDSNPGCGCYAERVKRK